MITCRTRIGQIIKLIKKLKPFLVKSASNLASFLSIIIVISSNILETGYHCVGCAAFQLGAILPLECCDSGTHHHVQLKCINFNIISLNYQRCPFHIFSMHVCMHVCVCVVMYRGLKLMSGVLNCSSTLLVEAGFLSQTQGSLLTGLGGDLLQRFLVFHNWHYNWPRGIYVDYGDLDFALLAYLATEPFSQPLKRYFAYF